MKIILNGKKFAADSDSLTVAGLLEIQKMPRSGVAVAVNNKIVRKADWSETRLTDGDKVTVITAVCGG